MQNKNSKILFYIISILLCLGTSLTNAEVPFFYQTEDVKSQGLPFSNAVVVGDTIYLAGMIGRDTDSVGPVEGGIVPETRKAMENIRETLNSLDADLDDIVKCVVYLADMKEWGLMSEEYSKFFHGNPPARSAFGVNGLARDARVEIECTAVKSSQ
jgi:2-iminobutanoate/2-iminopropanoate deaminase